MGAKHVAIMLIASGVAVPSTLGASCALADGIGFRCAVEPSGFALVAERLDEVSYLVAASACMDAPGALRLQWWVGLADQPAGVATADSEPTSDPACVQRAAATLVIELGTFDPPYACADVLAITPEGAAARAVCEED